MHGVSSIAHFVHSTYCLFARSAAQAGIFTTCMTLHDAPPFYAVSYQSGSCLGWERETILHRYPTYELARLRSCKKKLIRFVRPAPPSPPQPFTPLQLFYYERGERNTENWFAWERTPVEFTIRSRDQRVEKKLNQDLLHPSYSTEGALAYDHTNVLINGYAF